MAQIHNGPGAVVRNEINTNLVAYSDNFCSDIQYYFLRNVKQIATFDYLGDQWATVAGGAYCQTTFKTGNASYGNENTMGPKTVSLAFDPPLVLSQFDDGTPSSEDDFIYLALYVEGIIPNDITVGFSTLADGSDVGLNEYKMAIQAGLVDGWNYIRIAKAVFDKVGMPAWNQVGYTRLTFSGGETNTTVLYDTLRMIKADPGKTFPNPFQRQIDGQWVTDLTVNAGEWFLGVEPESGTIICRDLNPVNSLLAIEGPVAFNNFYLTMDAECLTDGRVSGPSWLLDENENIYAYILENELILEKNEGGVIYRVSRPFVTLKGDLVLFILNKQGSSVALKASINSQTYKAALLTMEIGTASYGKFGVCSFTNTGGGIRMIGITKVEYANTSGVSANSKIVPTPLYNIGDIKLVPYDDLEDGWTEADGKLMPVDIFPELFARLGYRFGGDMATVFRVPDCRGEFFRCADSGRGIDPGRLLGTWQADSMKNHAHRLELLQGTGGIPDWKIPDPTNNRGYTATASTAQTAKMAGFTDNKLYDGMNLIVDDLETRPRNLAMKAVIKCKNVYGVDLAVAGGNARTLGGYPANAFVLKSDFKIKVGVSNFAGNSQEVQIVHGMGAVPKTVHITPTANPQGYLGEYWVHWDLVYLYIGNTGSSTAGFSWMAYFEP